MAMIHPWTYALYAAFWVIGSIFRGRAREIFLKILLSLSSATIPLAIGEIVDRSLSGGSVLNPVLQTLNIALKGLPGKWSIENIPSSIMSIYYGYTLYAWSSIYIAPIIAMTLYSALKGTHP
ncbi:MAG: hypothetical protein QXE01_06190 [Sulfolobales archaeon]